MEYLNTQRRTLTDPIGQSEFEFFIDFSLFPAQYILPLANDIQILSPRETDE